MSLENWIPHSTHHPHKLQESKTFPLLKDLARYLTLGFLAIAASRKWQQVVILAMKYYVWSPLGFSLTLFLGAAVGNRHREGKTTLNPCLSIMHLFVIYCDRSTVPCLECNRPFQGRKASASQNSPFQFFQKMFSVLAGLLHVPPPAFQKKRWETDIICTELTAFNEQ